MGIEHRLVLAARIAVSLTVLLVAPVSRAYTSPMPIWYAFTDVSDTNPAEDLGFVEYFVMEEAWPAGKGFNIHFPRSDGYLPGSLALEQTPSSPLWDIELSQPGASEDGTLRAIAKVDIQTTRYDQFLSIFIVTFAMETAPTAGPRAQIVEVFDSEGRVLLNNYAYGAPEPRAAGLLLVLLAGLGLARNSGPRAR